MVDVVGGHTKVMFSSMVQTVPHIHSRQAARARHRRARARRRAARRSAIAETVPNYEAVNWWGMVAPVGTPKAIIDKLNTEIEAVQKSPEVLKQFAAEGGEPVPMKPDVFGAFMVSEMDKWGKVVKQGGIKAE